MGVSTGTPKSKKDGVVGVNEMGGKFHSHQ